MKNIISLNERILAKNVSVSNDDRETGHNGNDLILGASGAGKTTSYICPNLNNPSGNFVVQDTKGKLCHQFSASLRAKGYKVYTVDFVNPDKSCGYNPLSYLRRRSDGSLIETDIKKLAAQLVPQLDRNDPFWEKAAVRYIAMLIAFVMEALPENEHNMCSVIRMHQSFQSGEGKDMLNEWSEENPDSYSARKYNIISNSFSAEKMWNSIMEFANEALDPFDVAEFWNVFKNKNQLDMKELANRKCAVFVNVSDHDSSYGILSSIFYTQLLQVLLDEADKRPDGRLKNFVRLYLDDFAASASIPDFHNTVSIIRSRGIMVSIILQSLSQLESMYSEARAISILNQCDTMLYLGGSHDLKTAEYIANHINKTIYSVLTLPSDKSILIRRGAEPKIVDKIKPLDPITGLQCT